MNDGATQFVIAAIAVFLAISLAAMSAILLAPVVLVYLGYQLHRWKSRQPVRGPSTSALRIRDQKQVREAKFPGTETFLTAHLQHLIETWKGSYPAHGVYNTIVGTIGDLYSAENLDNPLPPISKYANSIEEGRYRDQLIAHSAKLTNPKQTLRLMNDVFGASMNSFVDALPPMATVSNDVFFGEWSENALSIPIVDTMPNVSETVHKMLRPYFEPDIIEAGLFAQLRERVGRNFHTMSGLEYPADPDRLTTPTEHPGDPREIVDGYLAGTPLHELFYASVPFSIPEPSRMEHSSILGGSGAGKTTLIQQIILDDLARDDVPGMVIIDPKGELVKRTSRLQVFADRLAERFVYVDPSDTPALNMFHAADRWNRMHDDSFRHSVESHAISNFAYIFSSVHSALTQKQATCFTFCVRLLFRKPEATLDTLLELLDDPAKSASSSVFRPVIERMDTTTKQFFKNDYYSTAFGETRQQIKARLYGIVIHPQLKAMFATPTRKLDLFECIQNKKVVLIDGALGTPGSEVSQLFCRYMVALTLNAVFERSNLPRSEWHPTYLIIDEFQLVADEFKTPEMLRLAREYNLGITLAFQEIHGKPFNDSLRASISTNTSIKYASSPEGVDINYAARDLRCDDDFIRRQTKTATHARFGCFVRGYLERPVSISVPFGNIQREPQMSDTVYQELRRQNAIMLRSSPSSKKPPDNEPPSEPEPPSPAPDPDSGGHAEPASDWR